MRSIATTTLTVALLASCAAGGEKTSIDTSTAAADTNSKTVTDSDIVATLDAPTEIKVGQAVPIVITVRNASTQPASLYLRGRDVAFDLVVADGAGAELWSRLHAQMIPAIIHVVQLEAGKTFVLRDVWRQQNNAGAPMTPGDYVVHGLVLTDGMPIRTPDRRLRIVP